MTARFDYPALAATAHAERMRRVHAWRDMLAKGRATIDRAQADELLWYEIEIHARRCAGEEAAQRHLYPRSFQALAKTARKTLTVACNAISDDDPNGCRKIRDLWELTRWLELCAAWTASIPKEPELMLEKAA